MLPSMSFWTPEIFEDLKARVARGDSASEIAAAFNKIYTPAKPMTRSAITGKVHRSGLVLGSYQGAPETIQRRIKARKEAKQESHRRTHEIRKARDKGETPSKSQSFTFGKAAKNSPKPPQATVKPISTAPSAIAVAFFERKPGQCSYIWDKEPHSHSLCCGAPIKQGARLSYCEAHHKRIMVPSRPLNHREAAA
jgi:hypothetical protein